MRNLNSALGATLLLMGGGVLANCDLDEPSIDIVGPTSGNEVFPVYDDQSPLKATITPRGAPVTHAEVWLNETLSERYPVDGAHFREEDNKLKFELSLGPVGSNAELKVQPGQRHVVVKAFTSSGCVSEDIVRVDGMDSNVRAIIVGISQYANIQNLDHAADDAVEIEKLLRRVYPTPQDMRVDRLIDQAAIRGNIMQALYDARDQLSSQATLIVYYSGHGLVEFPRRGQPKAYLVPFDGRSDGPEATMIRKNDIFEVFNQVKVSAKIFIFDSCFAGAPRGGGGAPANMTSKLLVYSSGGATNPNTASAALLLPSDVVGLVSSSGEQASYEDTRLKHGIFTYYLLEAIRSSAESDIRFSDLMEYAKGKIETVHGGIQQPQLLNVVDGDQHQIFLKLPELPAAGQDPPGST